MKRIENVCLMSSRFQFSFILFNLLLTCSLHVTIAVDENFTGHKLFRILPEDHVQMDALQRLRYHPPRNLQRLDFWSEPSEPLDSVNILVDPLRTSDLEKYLKGWNIRFQVVVPNLQRLLDEHARKNYETRIDKEVSIYDTYLMFDEAMSWLKATKELCGLRCTLINIGRSHEGRNLTVIKISSETSFPALSIADRKPSIWIDSGIHAREWISHSTAIYFIDRLVSDYDLDVEVRQMVNKYDWYVFPFVNPDGYQYSHINNRLWRKTRSKVDLSSCVGVDANRNFGFHWGSVGTSSDPCSDIFPGRYPFSEPETKCLSDFILSKNGTWQVFLSLHSYGQLWMSPYGYTRDKPKNYKHMLIASNAAKRAIEAVYGTEYSTGSASNVLYRSSGTSRDWAAGVAKIPFVYTIELRDKGSHGFLLPPEQILPTGIETWEGVKALMGEIDKIEFINKY